LTVKTKAPSITKEWLAQQKHPVAQLVLDIRRLDRLKEVFVKNFVLESNHKGRIHCQFNQLKSDENGTVTGRFSSSQPNLQQIPKKGDDGKLIRTIFVAEDPAQRWHTQGRAGGGRRDQAHNGTGRSAQCAAQGRCHVRPQLGRV
jgi:DNA polymerase I-like protein with 3'-5' exonuclease and polymerase domains